jgi:exodeoxyribonuclease-5
MLKRFVEESIQKGLGFEPTVSQREVISGLADFLVVSDSDLVFLLKGYAGTGKTTLLAAMVQTLQQFKVPFVLLAPTGRAAKVLSSYTHQPAFTIHKWIYRKRSSKDGFGRFVLGTNLARNTIFVVDEASMVSNQAAESQVFGSGRLLDDLVDFVREGKQCKLIVVGDTAQLPPVGLQISPALVADTYKAYGFAVLGGVLTDVMRQSAKSGILHNASLLRSIIESGNPVWPRFVTAGFADIERIQGSDLLEAISDSYSRNGTEETLMITRSNSRANLYNTGIRSQILGRDEEISRDDLLMIVRNNYYWAEASSEGEESLPFIANGDLARISRVGRYADRYGLRFVEADLDFPDLNDLSLKATLMLNTLSLETPALPQEEHKNLFYAILEDYAQDGKERKESISQVKIDPFFNALQVKFAYAVTCHKAQGGQWETVFIDQGYPGVEPGLEYLRWLYTALTRARSKVFLVNFQDDFFV